MRFSSYVPLTLLEELQTGISRQYGIAHVVLEPSFPADCAAQMPRPKTSPRSSAGPMPRPAPCILAGCRWERTEAGFAVTLRQNGKAELTPHLRHASEFLARRFGGSWQVTIAGSHEMDAAALRERSEQLRQEAVQQLPQAAAPKEKAAAKKPAGGAIMGKPFHAIPTPIREISMDTDKVTVEGEVFAVNHKEIKKRNAWVVSFDLTDYTSSVRINQYMDAERAKPILDGVKPGMWLQIMGRMTYSNFDNEDVLQPVAIQQAEKPQRQDTGPGEARGAAPAYQHVHHGRPDRHWPRPWSWLPAGGTRPSPSPTTAWCRTFPDGHEGAPRDKDIKMLYGCEAYFVNDVDDTASASMATQDWPLRRRIRGLRSGDHGVRPAATTPSPRSAQPSSAAARLSTSSRPSWPARARRMPPKITRAHRHHRRHGQGRADGMAEALPQFLAFCGDRPLVAHNADFDIGFIRAGAASGTGHAAIPSPMLDIADHGPEPPARAWANTS